MIIPGGLFGLSFALVMSKATAFSNWNRLFGGEKNRQKGRGLVLSLFSN